MLHNACLSGRGSLPSLIAIVLLPLFLVACGATETISRAGGFASAGVTYTDAVPAFYDHAFDVSVTAGSIELERARPNLPRAEDRRRVLQEQDDEFRERLAHLTALKQRAQALRAYFLALKGLVDADDATGITDISKSIVDRLAKIEPSIGALKILGTPAKDLMGPAATMIVGAYKASALRRELAERGAVIERELELQRAALDFLRKQVAADTAFQIQADEREPFRQMFENAASLPGNWRAQRIALFRRAAAIATADAAAVAAENMHQSWIAFVRGNLDGLNLATLIKDVENFITLVEKARSK